jgi:Leucine-rich repeat (LRR) protein
LTDLNVDGCFNLEDVSALMHLPLKTLTLGSGHRDHFWDADKVLPTLACLHTLNLNSLGLCADIFDRPGTESPCVAAMARLHSLHTLILDGTDLHDREFVKLEPLSASLRTLCVSDTEITDQSAGVLSRFTMLEYLSVESCKLSKQSLHAIVGLVNLRALYACNCPRMVRDASFSAISALGQLETLDISFNPVRRFEPLYVLQHLRSLDVTECNRSYSGSAVLEDECDIEEVARRALCDHLPGLVIQYVDRHADVRALSTP